MILAASLSFVLILVIVVFNWYINKKCKKLQDAESDKSRNWHKEGIDETIKLYLEHILGYQIEQISWYNEAKCKRRAYSEVLLTLALIFFTASLILPLIPGIFLNEFDSSEFGRFYAAGYISLIVTTIMLLGDRLFGHSKAWMRFSAAHLQMELIASEFYAKWLKILPLLGKDDISEESRTAALNLLEKFDFTLRNTVKTETENWKNLFTTQIEEFYRKITDKLNTESPGITEYMEKAEDITPRYKLVNLLLEFTKIPVDHLIKATLSKKHKSISKSLSNIDNTWLNKELQLGNYEIRYDLYSKLGDLVKTKYDIITLDGQVRIIRKLIEIKD